ncbi:hypothetical protein LOTGIDRAFT_107411, partial [Lottia gigantea]
FRFTVNSDNGQISNLVALDFESQSQYLLAVLAVDSGTYPRTATATVTINVQDINDNIPVFVQTFFEGSVPENEAIGTSVLTVTAVDADSTPTIDYIIQETNVPFRIDNTGRIFTTQVLDFELRQSLQFTVTTQQGRNSLNTQYRAGVRITVTNVNDAAPSLTINPAVINIPENQALGELPAFASATDQDPQNDFNRISYRMIYGDVSVFNLDSTTGRITTNTNFNTNGKAKYSVTVMAFDNGIPSLTDTSEVNVLLSRNFFSPVFEPVRYTPTISEITQVGNVIERVNATDRDTTVSVTTIHYEKTMIQNID